MPDYPDERPSWPETWLGVAEVISRRSRCVNSRVGAVVVTRDERLNSSGYNGPPRGLPVSGPCTGWCPRARAGEGAGSADYSACASVHAELNALLRADATLIEGGTMYVTRAPCINCARAIANSGLSFVRCAPNGEDDLGKAIDVFDYLHQCDVRAGYHGGPPEGRAHL